MSKRYANLKIFLFLASFAFFITTCGVPNYFYLGSSYIRENIRPGDVTGTPAIVCYNVTFQMTDAEQVQKCVDCPSVFLFYFLGNDDYYSSSGGKSDLINRFGNEYQSITRKGAIISVHAGEQYPLITSFTPTNYANIKASLYAFSFKSNRTVERPKYHIPIACDQNGRPLVSSNGTIDFRLEFDKEKKELRVLYDFDPSTSTYNSDDVLLRADGKGFDDIIVNLENFDNYKASNIDCQGIGETGNIKLYVLAALCASNGRFDNIYWSRLVDVCSFGITGAT